MTQPASPMLCILLATFQGEQFLPAFLESLRRQTCDDRKLVVRDDGSTDGTLAVLRDAAANDPRITILPTAERLGPAQNFGRLAAWAVENHFAYAAFADQDDVWCADKLERQMSAMAGLEESFGRKSPLLVHSDLGVIDEGGRRIAPSFERYAKLRRPKSGDLASRLVANDVAGCSMLVNRALLKAALPLPHATYMHDWWIAQCAAALGRIEYLSEPLVDYRRHSQNVIGGDSPWRRLVFTCFDGGRRWHRLRSDFAGGVSQAIALSERLRSNGKAPNAECLRAIDEYCAIMTSSNSRYYRAWRAFALPRASMHPLRELALLAKILTFNSAAAQSHRAA